MDLLLILLAARQPRWWHTAVIKFVENRFIGSSTHLTQRDAAQPDLLDFFDFTTGPWTTPPSPPAPTTPNPATCTPSDM
jgi:phospholipase C